LSDNLAVFGILKVDLLNEGVEPSRDILGAFATKNGVGFGFSETICCLAKQRLKTLPLMQATCHSLPFVEGSLPVFYTLYPK
jgi:hypothetical protein